MNEHDQWTLEQLKKLRNEHNQIVIDSAISLIQEQHDEIESLHGAMEGQLWSPKQWRS